MWEFDYSEQRLRQTQRQKESVYSRKVITGFVGQNIEIEVINGIRTGVYSRQPLITVREIAAPKTSSFGRLEVIEARNRLIASS
jgi:hypothetical protein